MDDKRFDELLEKAFEIEAYNESSREPSAEELSEAAPFTEKQLDYVKSICKKDKKPLWTKYIGKAAAIVLCFCLAGFGVMMTDPGIRATVCENIVQYIEEGLNIDFTEAHDDTEIDISKTVIGYIPEGFELCEDRSDKKADELSYSYLNQEDEYIVIDILASSDIELVTENGLHELNCFKIGEYTAYISYSDTQMQGSVYFGNKSFTVAISGMTDRDELIKIAENIEIKG